MVSPGASGGATLATLFGPPVFGRPLRPIRNFELGCRNQCSLRAQLQLDMQKLTKKACRLLCGPTPCIFRSITRIEDPGSRVESHHGRVGQGSVSPGALPRTPCFPPKHHSPGFSWCFPPWISPLQPQSPSPIIRDGDWSWTGTEDTLGRTSELTRNVRNGHRSHWTSFGWVCRQYVTRPLPLYFIDLAKGLPNLPPAKTPLESARNGYEYYKHLQAHDGHWPGECGGPLFLIPGAVFASYVTGMIFTDEERREMIRYQMNYTNEDGGWGMCGSYNFSALPNLQRTVSH